jgi:hypothetical protein
VSAEADELRRRFALVHTGHSQSGKLRELLDRGQFTEAHRLAESMGAPLERGKVVSLDRARARR